MERSGAISCDPCPDGTFQPAGGATQCETCSCSLVPSCHRVSGECASALDVSGTWSATMRCWSITQGGERVRANLDGVPVQVSQENTRLRLSLPDPFDSSLTLFSGVLVDDGKHAKRGNATLVRCDAVADPIDAAMMSLEVSLKPQTGKATMRGALNRGEASGFNGSPPSRAASCRVKLKLADPVDPGVAYCPAP